MENMADNVKRDHNYDDEHSPSRPTRRRRRAHMSELKEKETSLNAAVKMRKTIHG